MAHFHWIKMSWERDNYVVGTRYYVVGTRYYVVGTRYSCRGNEILCRGNEILCRGNEIIMLWERDLMSWERDKYFFSHVPSVLPYSTQRVYCFSRICVSIIT